MKKLASQCAEGGTAKRWHKSCRGMPNVSFCSNAAPGRSGNVAFLKGHLKDIGNSIPGVDTIARTIAKVDPDELSEALATLVPKFTRLRGRQKAWKTWKRRPLRWNIPIRENRSRRRPEIQDAHGQRHVERDPSRAKQNLRQVERDHDLPENS